MHRFPVACMFLVVAVAGCADDDGADPIIADPAPTVTSAGHLTWVHDGMQNLLDPSAFPGDLPEMELIQITDRISGEPTIGVTRNGNAWYASIDFDVPGGLPSTHYLRTEDQGATWRTFNPNIGNVLNTHSTSFDPYVYVDPMTSRVYALDMGPHVACNKVSWTDDEGATWITRDGACPLPVADHPTLFAGPVPGEGFQFDQAYPNRLYLCSNQLIQVQCSWSVDGGITWAPSVPVFGETPTAQAPQAALGDCGGLVGHGHASWATGVVYVGRGACGYPEVAVSHDAGISYQRIAIPNTDVAGNDLDGPFGHDVMTATDRSGRAYAFWTGDGGRGAFLSVSEDDGITWSNPWNVTAPGVTGVKLPGVVAGEDGRVAFQYIGTDNPRGHQVGQDWQAEVNATNHAIWKNATWNAYVGISLDAAGDNPVFATTTVNDPMHPLKRGHCNGRCPGNGAEGGFYDFIDIDIDPITGQIWTALVDVCTQTCDEPDATAEAGNRSVGAVGRQTGGTMLLVDPIPAA